jgi:hypothetical protein
VSQQSNDRDADLNRRISEQDARIRSNPRDAVAYRERGFFHARKHDLDQALKDLNQAVVLNPKDSRAFGLRGLVLHALKEDSKAIADLEKAIELDPGHADLYRSHRDEIAGSASAASVGASLKRPNGAATLQKGLGGFFKRLAQYYAEFLSTDFKKQRLPRRRLQNSDEQGRMVGIPLRKYPGFEQKLWQELAKPIGSGLSFNVPRGLWRSTLPKAVVDATATHIAGVTQEQLNAIVNGVLDRISKMPDRKGADPVVAFRAKSMPLETDLDDASPMERKVLHWLSQVPIIRDLEDDCEIVAQFELGKYLKQLDPTYHHPDYRVDFLVRISEDHASTSWSLSTMALNFISSEVCRPG